MKEETYLYSKHSIDQALKQNDDNYNAEALEMWHVYEKPIKESWLEECRKRQIKIKKFRQKDIQYSEDKIMIDLYQNDYLLWVEIKKPDNEKNIFENSQTILILDHITDAQNFGSIIRSAAALGVNAIFYPQDNQAQITPRVRFISQGATEIIPCYKITNINQLIKKLQNNGFWIYGFTEKATKSLHETSFSSKAAVIIGSEDKGIREHTLGLCDFLIKIPTTQFSCINAANASSIVCYEIARQKHKTLQ